MTARAHALPGEEGRAFTRAVLGLTLGVGAMGAAAAALIGDGFMLVGIPTAALAIALARGRTPAAGWAGVAVWLLYVPRMHAEALLVPLAMALICLGIGVGRDRLGRWFREPDPARASDESWIEEV